MVIQPCLTKWKAALLTSSGRDFEGGCGNPLISSRISTALLDSSSNMINCLMSVQFVDSGFHSFSLLRLSIYLLELQNDFRPWKGRLSKGNIPPKTKKNTKTIYLIKLIIYIGSLQFAAAAAVAPQVPPDLALVTVGVVYSTTADSERCCNAKAERIPCPVVSLRRGEGRKFPGIAYITLRKY